MNSITSSKQCEGDNDLGVSLSPVRGVREKPDRQMMMMMMAMIMMVTVMEIMMMIMMMMMIATMILNFINFPNMTIRSSLVMIMVIKNVDQ